MKHQIESVGRKAIAIRELQNIKRKVVSGGLYDAIEGVTLSTTDPVVIALTGHGFSTNDRVAIVGTIVGTVELMGWTGLVTDSDTDAITLQGTDSSDFTAWTSGGAVTKLVEVSELEVDDTLFSVIGIDGDASTLADSVVDFTGNVEVLPKDLPLSNVTLVSGSPVKLTITGHGLVTGDYVSLDGVGGTVELNGKGFVAEYVDANNINLKGTNSVAFTAFTSGGTVTTKKTRMYTTADASKYRLMVDFHKAPAL